MPYALCCLPYPTATVCRDQPAAAKMSPARIHTGNTSEGDKVVPLPAKAALPAVTHVPLPDRPPLPVPYQNLGKQIMPPKHNVCPQRGPRKLTTEQPIQGHPQSRKCVRPSAQNLQQPLLCPPKTWTKGPPPSPAHRSALWLSTGRSPGDQSRGCVRFLSVADPVMWIECKEFIEEAT